MPITSVHGLSLILQTNAEVDRAADLLRALGLDVVGEDGYVEVAGPSIALSIMRGAMVDVPPLGGVLLQVAVDDITAAVSAGRDAGASVVREPTTDEEGNASAFLQSSLGLTIELLSRAGSAKI